MRCMKCNHALPDDSEFCQYCGNRIEKMTGIPEAAATMTVNEATAKSDLPIKEDGVAPARTEIPKPSVEEVIQPLPDFKNMERDEVLKAMLRIYEKEAMEVMNSNSQNQPDQAGAMDVGLVPEKARKAKKVKQPKKKYCVRCGSRIDHQSKQCTGCGKKYFKGIRLHKFSVAVTVLSLVIAALMGLNVYQYLNNCQLNEELNKSHDEITNLNERILDYRREVAALESKINSQRTIIDSQYEEIDILESSEERYYSLFRFYDKYVVVIGDDGTDVYHRYGCSRLDLSNGFWVVGIENAKDWGCIKCSLCR